MKHTQISSIKVRFSLPDWFGAQRLNYEMRRIHPPGHVWVGQVDFDNIKYGNHAYDALGKLRGVTEICSHPMGPWVEFEIKGRVENIPKKIAATQARVERLLFRYRESRAA